MADTNSIFYQIGLKVKGSVADATAGLLSGDNTWTGTNDFEKAVTVAYADGTALDVTGTASTSGLLTAESLESTGDTDAKGNLTVSGSATISKDLTVEGNLTISGTEAIVDADSLDVTDNIIKLSDGANAGDYTKDSGLYFERGAGKSASAFVFDESEESFVVGTLEGDDPTGSNADIANTTPAPLTVGSLKLVGPVSLTTSDAVITFSTSGGTGNDGVTRVSSITIDGVSHQAAVSLNGGYTNSPALGLNFLSGATAYGVNGNQIRIVFENGELARITNSKGNATYNYADASPQQLGNLDDFNAGYDA